MSIHLGDYAAGATLGCKFNTDVNGSPFTLGGTPAVSVWKQGSATPITAGVVLTVDYQSVTGLHDVAIDLTDPSYASGKDYQVYLSAGSVNGISRVGQVLAEFSIEHRSVATVATNVSTLLTRLSAARAGYLDNLSAGAVALEASLQGLITTVASLAAASATAVWASVTRTLTSGANIALAKGTGITGFNDLSAAQVNAECDTALADAGVTTAAMAHLDADVSSRLATNSYTAPDNAGIAIAGAAAASAASTASTINSKIGTPAVSVSADIDALPTNAELATALAALLTTAMTESYSADGAAPTPAQALFLILQRLTEFSISGTVVTIRKLDGAATAATLTLDDAISPTSSTRAA